VTYAGYLQGANTWVSISAFVLGASMLVFLGNLVWSQVFVRKPAGANPWGSKSIEFQLSSPVPVHDFDRIPTFGLDPYPYGAIDEVGFAGQRGAVAPGRPML
jgi:cytochrome c oxidase subunit 1